MSALGQKRTCAAQNGMSALPPKWTFVGQKRNMMRYALCGCAMPLRAIQKRVSYTHPPTIRERCACVRYPTNQALAQI